MYFNAYEMSALYPGEKITYRGSTPMMTLTPYRSLYSWAGSYTPVKVDEAHGIRQEFHISTLKDAKKVTASIMLAMWTPGPAQMPANGGNWYYLVNGKHKYYLKDYGGWQVKERFMGKKHSKYVEFLIPLSALKDDPN